MDKHADRHVDKHEGKYKILGLNVTYYRRLKGLSQTQLAEKIYISRSHLSRIEAPNGVRSFSINVVFEIADVLGIETEKLFEKRS